MMKLMSLSRRTSEEESGMATINLCKRHGGRGRDLVFCRCAESVPRLCAHCRCSFAVSVGCLSPTPTSAVSQLKRARPLPATVRERPAQYAVFKGLSISASHLILSITCLMLTLIARFLAK